MFSTLFTLIKTICLTHIYYVLYYHGSVQVDTSNICLTQIYYILCFHAWISVDQNDTGLTRVHFVHCYHATVPFVLSLSPLQPTGLLFRILLFYFQFIDF